MFTHHRMPVCLSIISTDLPIWSVTETAGTLYQKDDDRFHLLLTESSVLEQSFSDMQSEGSHESEPASRVQTTETPRLLWLEISPYRVVMTMQGNGKFSYRHFWEQGVYGLSRYWLQSDSLGTNGHLRLRNFTRSLVLKRNPLPQHLRLEYELWSNNVQLGSYVLNLEVHH